MSADLEPSVAGPNGPGGIRALVGNVGSLLTANVVNRATNFVVYAMVARYLGVRELGQLALAVSLFYLVGRLALLGLETHTTREIARDREHAARDLGTALVVVAVAAACSWPLMWVFVELMGYAADTARVVLILFLGMVPYAMSLLTEATFLGWERSKYVAYANSPIWVIHTVVVFVLLQAGQGVEAIALSLVAAYVAIIGAHWLLLARTIRPAARVVLAYAPTLVRAGLPFLGIQGMAAISGSVNVIVLSVFAGEAAVGIFSAGKQLIVPIHLLFQTIGQGVFPAMVRSASTGAARLRTLSGRLIELTLALAIPASVGLSLVAGPILLAVYRDPEFLESAAVLRILVWTTVHAALTAVLGQILWSTRREALSLRIAVINTAIMVVAALILIRRFDVVGAASASVIVGSISVVQHYVPVARLFGRWDPLRWLWKPAVASAVMAAFLLSLPDAPLWVRVPGGAVVYGVALGLLLARAGGYAEWRRRMRSVRAGA